MRKVFRYIFAFALCWVSVAAFSKGRPVFFDTVHNFGAFREENGLAECQFTFINGGDAPLTVLSASATCGCTTPQYPRKAIQPGDSAIISVAYDPSGRPGRFTKSVDIVTDGLPSKVRLDITGVVIGSDATIGRRYPVDMGPLRISKSTYPLGDVMMGRFKTVYLEGYNRSEDSLRIEVSHIPPYLDIVVAPETAAPGEQVTFIAYVAPGKGAQYGVVEDTITVTPLPGMQFRLPVLMEVQEDFTGYDAARMEKAPIAVPSANRIELGRISRSNSDIKASLRLENAGKSDLIVRRIYSVDPGVKASIKSDKIKKGKSAEIEISVDATRQQGAMLNSRLQIITNDPLHPVYTVRIVGEWNENQ